ncbi:hypothetical protein F53441_7995 [Fusarium austroafricanum]|uniref:Cytochrome P450 monooxygenase n=1 Tax=Fusarium austroafricanum TaxID=2364996 RepID=A0A8H4NRL1_9HYPO|nr:hypothetical protein F53441_7995 [Fusarium austroafricanum]
MFLDIFNSGLSWLAYSVAGLSTWYILSSVIAWYRLRHIPGPFLASFSYFWVAYGTVTGTTYDNLVSLHRKYGSLVRVGPNEVLSDDPALVRKFSNIHSTYTKGDWYLGSRFNPYHDPMFLIKDPIKHDRVKAKLSPAYSGRDAPNLEDVVDKQVGNLVQLIKEKYISTKSDFRPMNMTRIASLFTIDVISHLSLGSEFGCLKADFDIHGINKAFTEHLLVMSLATDIPWLRNFIFSPLFLWFFGPTEKDSKGVGKLMKLANTVVRERYDPNAKEQRDMLVYLQLKQELKEAISEGRASSPITDIESRRLPYLQAVIYETIRIRPTTMSMFFKDIPAGGESIHGHFLPAGTSVGTNMSALLHSEALFGPDAHLFRPERFLEVDKDTRVKMKGYVDLMFGYGRWICAGKPIALMELNKVLFELLREFDFQLAEPTMAMKTKSFLVFYDQGPILRVTKASEKSQ